jgi:hypothetical protein
MLLMMLMHACVSPYLSKDGNSVCRFVEGIVSQSRKIVFSDLACGFLSAWIGCEVDLALIMFARFC